MLRRGERASCTAAAGIAGSGYETAISPDGRTVYVSNQTPGGIAVFSRASDGSLQSRAAPAEDV